MTRDRMGDRRLDGEGWHELLTIHRMRRHDRKVLSWDVDDDDDDDEFNEEDSESADLETFIRLLSTKARTYADLIGITGVSFRTAKVRLRSIRQTHNVEDSWIKGDFGSRLLVMFIPPVDDHGRPIVEVITVPCPIHRGSSCIHCNGSGSKTFTRTEWNARHPKTKAQRE